MKKFQKLAFVMLATTAIFTTSCGDDDDDSGSAAGTAPTLTAEQKISGNTFIISDQTIEVNALTISTFDSLDACDKDDLLIFNVNKTGAFDEGLTKCDPQDPQADPFEWVLLTDNKLRIIQEYNNEKDTTVVDVIKNDGTNLSLQISERDGADTSTFTISYIKQ